MDNNIGLFHNFMLEVRIMQVIISDAVSLFGLRWLQSNAVSNTPPGKGEEEISQRRERESSVQPYKSSGKAKAE